MAKSAYSYDGDGRTTGTTYTGQSAAALGSFAYTYDQANLQHTFTDNVGVGSSITYTSSYDPDGQLTGYANSSTNAGYDYDANGNRNSTSSTVVATDTTTTTDYAAGLNNEIANDGRLRLYVRRRRERHSKTLLVAGAATGETQVYAWDNRNRLLSVIDYTNSAKTTTSWLVSYTYDMNNNLVERGEITLLPTVTLTTDHYIYSQGQVVLDLADDASVRNATCGGRRSTCCWRRKTARPCRDLGRDRRSEYDP